MSAPDTIFERARRVAISLGGILAAGIVGTVTCRLVAGYWVPPAAFFQAVVNGALNAMFAIGLVLIYRATRIVNFSQGSLGILGVMVFLMLAVVEGWNFYFALGAGIAVAALTGLIVEMFVVRRLTKAPRLALTVVTIGIGQVVAAAAGIIPRFFIASDDEIPAATNVGFSSFSFKWFPLVYTGNHIAVIVISLLVMLGLAAFFKFTSAGIAIRGAAENDDRAALLGINVSSLSSLIWVLAATLSGLAAILNFTVQTQVAGVLVVGTASASLLLKALAAAVVGKMENLPVTVAAAIAIGVFEQGMFWAFDTTALIDLALLVLIVGVLFAQRGKLARTDEGTTGAWAANVEIRGIPQELKDVPSVRAGRRRAFTLLIVAALAYPWVMSPSQTSLGSVYVIYGIIVISLVVLTGWGGQISLGQFAFVATGAAVGGSLTSKVGVPFPIALVLASAAGAVVAVLIGLPAMRIKGLFLAVTTLAFAVTTSSVFLNPRFFGWLIPSNITRPKFLFLDGKDERVYFYFCVLSLLFALWVARGLRQSRAGRVLIAMRENERTAQSYSINRVKTRLATFAISGFLAAFAGVLLAHQQLAVRAPAFGPEQSILIFLIAVIGGLGSLGGSLAGVAYIAAVNIFVEDQLLQQLASGAGVMLILLFYPGGVGGLFFLARDAWLRRVAMRQRIFVPSLIGDYRVLDGEHTRVTLAPKFGGSGQDEEVAVKYRIPSVIGVRGESQQGRRWRYE